jgi:hypothetical protein
MRRITLEVHAQNPGSARAFLSLANWRLRDPWVSITSLSCVAVTSPATLSPREFDVPHIHFILHAFRITPAQLPDRYPTNRFLFFSWST